MVLEHIVAQHAEDAAFLWLLRSRMVCAPHYNLKHLTEFDDRLHAHIEGLLIAETVGWAMCESQLSVEESGEMFVATVLALEGRNAQRLEQLFFLAETPAMRPGLVSAFGWISTEFLQDIGDELLISQSPLHRLAGIAGYAMHRVDPGQMLAATMNDSDQSVRAQALRATGELARRDLLVECQHHLTENDNACRFWAAWSAVLLGDRREAQHVLQDFCLSPNPFRERALQLLLRSMELSDAHKFLTTLGQNPSNTRYIVQGVGIAGASSSVPWLIEQMQVPTLARIAGESFTFITGVDIVYQDLKAERPEGFESGPTEDPHDENVEIDPDDDLAWPDSQKIQAWRDTKKRHFQDDVCYFMGEPVSVQHCKKVLRDGYQRQRIAAALYLSLEQTGSVFFECRAPAWRQERWLIDTSQEPTGQRW